MISESEIIELIKKSEEGPTLDYKEDLPLATDGDKAEFVKDIIALANSGEMAHIIVGVEDGTGKPVGIQTHHTVEKLNQILRDKCDPPISVEYVERNILGYKIGVVEITGENPPYIVSVPDKFGGQLSANRQKSFYIQRGTVFVRNFNINEGARRADLDKMYQVKYVTLQADLKLSHEVSVKPSDEQMEVDISFVLINLADVTATDALVVVQFKNVREIVTCKHGCVNISHLNNDNPTVQIPINVPVIRPIRTHLDGVTVKVDKDVEEIIALVVISAANMRTKEGTYVIPLKVESKNV